MRRTVSHKRTFEQFDYREILLPEVNCRKMVRCYNTSCAMIVNCPGNCPGPMLALVMRLWRA